MTDEILDGYNEFRKRQQKAHGDYDWGSFSAGTELIERKYKGKLYSERCHSMHDMKEETRLKEYWKEQDEEWQKKVEELRKWIWKNNTIPLKGTNLNLATMDGGWVNGLKLGEAIDHIFKT